jgi:hypothetical protein
VFPDRFDRLGERLLRAGIAPRHVRRYVTELRDHFHDLVREETQNGRSQEAAEASAHARIGSDGDLSDTMSARSDLRSITARFPFAVFGFGPAFLLASAVVVAVLAEGAFLYAHLGFVRWRGDVPSATPPDWAKFLTFGWNCW